MKTIWQLDHGGAVDLTAAIEAQKADQGPNSSVRWTLAEILALASAGDLDSVLVAGNDAGGIGITELANIDNLVNDFDLLVDNGNVQFNFGNAPSGVFGLDAFADQMQFTADQWVAISSDGNMSIVMDVDIGYIEIQNLGNYLRITSFDIEVGTEINGYLTTTQTNQLVQGQINALTYKQVKLTARTTAALPANTVSGSNTILTANANGALPAQDGVTLTVTQSLGVFNEATQTKIGVYVVTQVGDASHPWILTRRGDSNSSGELDCAVYNVDQGTRFAGTSWKQITPAPTIGSSNIVFKPFGDNIIEDSVSGYYKIVSTSGVLSTTSV